MMEKLVARGGAIARDAQQQKVRDVAQQLRGMFGSSAVEVEEARVLVRGKGMIKRWLIDPSLRFLGGGLK
jgi:ribosomal protein L22